MYDLTKLYINCLLCWRYSLHFYFLFNNVKMWRRVWLRW